jgi:pimeloyl-ACP methyl ester carboxylesterase
MGNVVLVHGAWVDSSCWDLVAPTLRDHGHRVEAVQLHRGTLAADTAAAQDVINRLGAEVVACGWSYGGMVITGLDLPAESHLVYLAAYMPDDGESAMSLTQRHQGDIASALFVDSAGDVGLAGEALDDFLWGDAPAEPAAAIRASLRSQAMATLTDSPGRFAWRDTPTTFVICRQDRTINPELQREMAQRATHVIEWDTSHSPMLSRPDLVVGLLDGLANP